MSDLISRQAAVDAAVQSINDWDDMFIQEANCRIRDAINELPPAQQWIPCSVALPIKEGVYLVTDETAYGAKISLRYWNIHTTESFWSGFESDVVRHGCRSRIRGKGKNMVHLGPCYRKNLCVDCDSEICGHAGVPEADCPLQICEHPDLECKDCDILKEYVEAYRKGEQSE